MDEAKRMRYDMTSVFLIVACCALWFAGCDNKVVDVDIDTEIKSLDGIWILNCDSVGAGSMELRRDPSNTTVYTGTVLIEKRVYQVTCLHIRSDNVQDQMYVYPPFTSPDTGGVDMLGNIQPLTGTVRGHMTVYRKRWSDILFQDSVTAQKR
jgi:hypothetical protein